VEKDREKKERDCGDELGMWGEGIAVFLYSERDIALGPSIGPLNMCSNEMLT
jgi:hypothetical protein